MATGKEYPVSLVVRAVDKITGPLGAMTAKLKAFSAPFAKLEKGFSGLGKATGIPRLASAFSGVGMGLKNVASETIGLGVRLLALGATGVFALGGIIHSSIEAGDQMAKMADRVGLGINAYAALRFALAQSDVTQEEFDSGMTRFSKALGDAKRNSGPLLEFLRSVAPELALQVQGAKSVEGALSLMTDAFVRLKDPSKRAALSSAAFGRGNIQIGEALHSGSAEIQRRMVDYLDLAGSQEEFGRGSSDLVDKLRRTTAAFEGLKAHALGPLLPAFGRVADRVTSFLVENRGGIEEWATRAGDAIEGWVKSGGLERLTVSLGKFADGVKEAWDFIGGMKGALVGLGLYMGGPLIASVVSLIPAFAELGIALLATPTGPLVIGLGALALAFTDTNADLGPFSDNFKAFKDDAKDTGEAIKFLVDQFKDLKKFFSMANDDLKAWKAEAAGPNASFESRFISALDTASNPLKNPVLNPVGTGYGALRDQVAKIRVEFGGAPAGTRVNVADDGTNMSIDTSVGYANSSH